MTLPFFRTASIMLAALAALAGPAGARPHPTPTPAPTPAPVADPAITRIARQQFVAWQSGTINKSLYAPGLVVKITDDKVDQNARALGALGALTDTVYIGPFASADIPPDAHGYIYQMKCTEGAVYLWMIVDGQGKIASIFFRNRLDVETIEVPAATPVASPPP
jgi:hypothetical protein